MKSNHSRERDHSMNLPYCEDFLLHLQTNNLSPETVYNYERDLTSFSNFLLEDIKTSFESIDKITLDRYKAYLASYDRKTSLGELSRRRLSAFSINRMLSSLRRYLKYLIDMDHKVPVPPEALKLLKTPRTHSRVAEFDQLVKLIESPVKFETIKLVAIRNRAMLEMLFSTGMRISELLSLNRNHIDNTGKIFIRGKGKKERFVYLTNRASKYIGKYLTRRRDGNPALFIPYRGRNAGTPKARISSNYLQMTIKRYRELLGINVPTSAHSLRHGFATYSAEQGANPAALQILLGHESLQTTTRYVHASDRYAEQTHKQFHPLK